MKMHPDQKAFVLLSGGQDSFVCLIWALANFNTIEAVTIHYGQSHAVETDYAKKIAAYYGVKQCLFSIEGFMKSIADSSLFDSTGHHLEHKIHEHLPASFVPNRNGLFLTIAANQAFRQKMKHIHIVTGVCETDFSGYPDCRDAYIKAKEKELSLGLDVPVTIHTPLMWKNKAGIFLMADEAGKSEELKNLTLTCYNGDENMNEWGRGCGECPSCLLRKKGFEEYILLKKTL
ncbi:MAG: 7-cyano-7-deazaguanine synthase QueC [Bacteroidales bacterium]